MHWVVKRITVLLAAVAPLTVVGCAADEFSRLVPDPNGEIETLYKKTEQSVLQSPLSLELSDIETYRPPQFSALKVSDIVSLEVDRSIEIVRFDQKLSDPLQPWNDTERSIFFAEWLGSPGEELDIGLENLLRELYEKPVAITTYRVHAEFEEQEIDYRAAILWSIQRPSEFAADGVRQRLLDPVLGDLEPVATAQHPPMTNDEALESTGMNLEVLGRQLRDFPQPP